MNQSCEFTWQCCSSRSDSNIGCNAVHLSELPVSGSRSEDLDVHCYVAFIPCLGAHRGIPCGSSKSGKALDSLVDLEASLLCPHVALTFP